MEEKKYTQFRFTHIMLPPKHKLPICSWFLTFQAHESSSWHSDTHIIDFDLFFYSTNV